MSVTIVTPNPALVWNGQLTVRSSTRYLIIHHAASTGDVYAIHNAHLAKGWKGIAYNFYIRTDGTIYEGRGWDKEGGHTEGYNSNSIGICMEGNYETTQDVPIAQQRSCIALMAEALSRYPSITSIGGHNDYNSTACPGQYFPKTNVISSAQIYSSVASAANMLVQKGVINSPDYWVDNFFRVQNLGALIIKLGNSCKSYVTYNAQTVYNAINRLAEVGIIDSPGYWNIAYSSLPYLDTLLINSANRS